MSTDLDTDFLKSNCYSPTLWACSYGSEPSVLHVVNKKLVGKIERKPWCLEPCTMHTF